MSQQDGHLVVSIRSAFGAARAAGRRKGSSGRRLLFTGFAAPWRLWGGVANGLALAVHVGWVCRDGDRLFTISRDRYGVIIV